MEIRAALSDTWPLSSYSTGLTKAIVTDITLHADKSVTLMYTGSCKDAVYFSDKTYLFRTT